MVWSVLLGPIDFKPGRGWRRMHHILTDDACICQDNMIENFIVEQLSGFLNQNLLSTNPYPELLVRMRMRQVCYFIKLSDARQSVAPNV